MILIENFQTLKNKLGYNTNFNHILRTIKHLTQIKYTYLAWTWIKIWKFNKEQYIMHLWVFLDDWYHYMSDASKMPSSLQILKNGSFAKGLMNISASWLCVSTKVISTSPFITWSRIKWCMMLIYTILECMTGYLVMFIALVLSHHREMHLRFRPKSLSCYFNHKLYA